MLLPPFNFSFWFPVLRTGKVSRRKLYYAQGCFEQEEEVCLEVGLDAVALGRNIDHGVGEREREREREREGGGRG